MRAIKIVKSPEWHDFKPTFAAQQLAKRHQIQVSKETVRQWMRAEGIWQSKGREIREVHQCRHPIRFVKLFAYIRATEYTHLLCRISFARTRQASFRHSRTPPGSRLWKFSATGNSCRRDSRATRGRAGQPFAAPDDPPKPADRGEPEGGQPSVLFPPGPAAGAGAGSDETLLPATL